jgi:alpha-1,3-rhamnosyl/mannosyltransferase
LQRPYFFYYGHASENKNINRILQAFAARDPALSGHEMVFAGGWGEEPRQAWREQVAELKLGDSVRHLGRVADADLVALLAAAEAMVFPSLGEGFGLPILEAYASGTPVLTSREGGSTAEVAHGHATLVDARDVESIAEGLSLVVEHSPGQRAAAKAYARSMSWNRVARETLDVYRDVLTAGQAPSATRLDRQGT